MDDRGREASRGEGVVCLVCRRCASFLQCMLSSSLLLSEVSKGRYDVCSTVCPVRYSSKQVQVQVQVQVRGKSARATGWKIV